MLQFVILFRNVESAVDANPHKSGRSDAIVVGSPTGFSPAKVLFFLWYGSVFPHDNIALWIASLLVAIRFSWKKSYRKRRCLAVFQPAILFRCFLLWYGNRHITTALIFVITGVACVYDYALIPSPVCNHFWNCSGSIRCHDRPKRQRHACLRFFSFFLVCFCLRFSSCFFWWHKKITKCLKKNEKDILKNKIKNIKNKNKIKTKTKIEQKTKNQPFSKGGRSIKSKNRWSQNKFKNRKKKGKRQSRVIPRRDDSKKLIFEKRNVTWNRAAIEAK